MRLRILLILPTLLFIVPSSHAAIIPSATDVCLKLLSNSEGYSLILRGNEPYIFLSRPLPEKGQFSLSSIMARYPGGSAIVKSLAELSKLKWVKDGTWDFHADADGIFEKIIRYHISRDAFFAIEMKLELNQLNEEVVGHLVGALETYRVNALVSGVGHNLAVYRLDLNDMQTRSALKIFLKFLKKNISNALYVEAIAQSSRL